MLALAVVGAGAGAVGRGTARLAPRLEAAVLAAYGFGAAFAYGLVINLWDWPLRETAASDITFDPTAGVTETLRAYWRFYTTTSLAWDGAGAVANAAIIATVGVRAMHALRRVERRIAPPVTFAAAGTTPTATFAP